MSIVNRLHARVYWPFQDGASFADAFRYVLFMLFLVMPSCLFLAALWSPDKRSWHFVCGVFVTFPLSIQGQGWCLVVSFPEICLFLLLNNKL